MGRFSPFLRRSLDTLRDRDVAAGYAVAKATVGAMLPWLAVWILLVLVDSDPIPVIRNPIDATFVAIPLVTVLAAALALVVGALFWASYFPDRGWPLLGAVSGAVLTAACVAASTGIVLSAYAAGTVVSQDYGESAGQILFEFALVTVGGVVIGFLFFGWLALLVGALVGWYHERKRGDREPATVQDDSDPHDADRDFHETEVAQGRAVE